MDVGAFVQENKRWLLGCAIGLVVWLVASSVLASIYNVSVPTAKKLGAPTGAVYDATAKQAAQDENDKLRAEQERLKTELGFTQTDRFLPAGKGRLDDYVLRTGRELKQEILTSAQRRDVQFVESAVTWEVPVSQDDHRATLFGLEVLQEVEQRLFAAHEDTRKKSEDAIGLRAILSLKLDARRNQRTQARHVRAGEVDPREFLVQEQVSFQFQADEPTLAAFLESCRRPGRTLVVDSWQVLKPAKPGEPCTVKGSVQAIAWKDTATSKEGKV